MFNPSKIIFNGKITNTDKLISVFSPSFQHGLTVFEGIRLYINTKGEIVPLFIDEHINRLIRSCHFLDIPSPKFQDVYNDISELIKNDPPQKSSYLKFIINYSEYGAWSNKGKPDRICFYYEQQSMLDTDKTRSSEIRITSFTRISTNVMPPKVKCGANYINSRFGFIEVNRDSDELIYPIFLDNNGFVTESSGACVFCLKNQRIITPPLFNSILPSITRDFILNKFHIFDNNFSVIESQIDRWDLKDADSIFIAGTNLEIVHVKKFEGKEFKINKKLENSLKNLFLNELD